jgi:hypothetical protein
MRETMNMRGELSLQLVDREGRVVQDLRRKNRIVKSGRQLVAELFGGPVADNVPTRVTHIAVGNEATPATDADTALVAERLRKPIQSVEYAEFDELVGSETVRRVRVKLQTELDYEEGNNTKTALQEAGIFTAEEGGIMYNRVVFEPVKKTQSFKLMLVWEVTF